MNKPHTNRVTSITLLQCGRNPLYIWMYVWNTYIPLHVHKSRVKFSHYLYETKIVGRWVGFDAVHVGNWVSLAQPAFFQNCWKIMETMRPSGFFWRSPLIVYWDVPCRNTSNPVLCSMCMFGIWVQAHIPSVGSENDKCHLYVAKYYVIYIIATRGKQFSRERCRR